MSLRHPICICMSAVYQCLYGCAVCECRIHIHASVYIYVYIYECAMYQCHIYIHITHTYECAYAYI